MHESFTVESGRLALVKFLDALRFECGQRGFWGFALHNQLDVMLHFVGVIPKDTRVVARIS